MRSTPTTRRSSAATAPCCCARQGGQAERARGDRRGARGGRGPRRGPRRPAATVEGGDTVWLDDETLLVGIGYRTNPAAVEALRTAFPGVEVISFDLPHWNGAGEVMHLMSFISPLDRDLALVYPRIAPTRLMWLLAERGIGVVEVPDEEFEIAGPERPRARPRRALALEGNDETRRRMERAGVDVVTYRGDEISRKGDGGPTCLTRPLCALTPGL